MRAAQPLAVENDPHRGFYFHSGEGQGSTLAAVTITNGYASDGQGGGIKCVQSNPTIATCIITDNTADGWAGLGGGIYCEEASPTILNCTQPWPTVILRLDENGLLA